MYLKIEIFLVLAVRDFFFAVLWCKHNKSRNSKKIFQNIHTQTHTTFFFFCGSGSQFGDDALDTYR
jgi:hypothetical protein